MRMDQGTIPQPARRASANALAALFLAGLSFSQIGDAAAQADGWIRWPGAAYASQSDAGVREFAREWEATPPKGFPTLSAANLAPLKAAIARYREIVAQGGWEQLPDVQLRSGMSHAAVGAVRRHLVLSGDLREDGAASLEFDYYVEKALMRYQASNGLPPTGVLDRHTLAALNVPAELRLRQLEINLKRLGELARSLAKRYVLVNIPAAQIEAVENNQVISRHSGVVGKPDRPTPLLHSAISELNFNPVRPLPPTGIQRDLIPNGQDVARRGQSGLAKNPHHDHGAAGLKLLPVTG